MPTYRTCTGCKFQGAPCNERRKLAARIAGLGITSVKFKCEWRRPAFSPGELVFAQTVRAYGPDGPIVAWFAGAVMRELRPGRYVVYIHPGTLDTTSLFAFEPHGGHPGFCRLPLMRLRPREGIAEPICPSCEVPTRLLPHAVPCFSRDAVAEEPFLGGDR